MPLQLASFSAMPVITHPRPGLLYLWPPGPRVARLEPATLVVGIWTGPGRGILLFGKTERRSGRRYARWTGLANLGM